MLTAISGSAKPTTPLAKPPAAKANAAPDGRGGAVVGEEGVESDHGAVFAARAPALQC